MDIIGICPFSFVEADGPLSPGEQAERLYSHDRMELCLRGFDLLTLPGLRAQDDQDFRFIVMASNLMPGRYRARLKKMCNALTQAELHFFDPLPAVEALNQIFREPGLGPAESIRFRLNHGDCVSPDFVSLLRREGSSASGSDTPLCIAVRRTLHLFSDGQAVTACFAPAQVPRAGTGLYHPCADILPNDQPFEIATAEDGAALILHNGINPGSTPDPASRKPLSSSDLGTTISSLFPFLGEEARVLVGIQKPTLPNTAPEMQVHEEAPSWLKNLAGSRHRRGFFISDDDFAIQMTDRATDTLYVSFDNLGDARNPTRMRSPWGYSFALKQAWSHLGVMAFEENWFRSWRLWQELTALQQRGIFEGYDRVILSGTSMGGYAACAFAPLAPGCTVIAFSPQSSLDPDIAPWGRRYPASRSLDWQGPCADAAREIGAAGSAWIFHDPMVPEDLAHANRLAGPGVNLLGTRRSGHFSAQFLGQTGILSKVVRECVDGTMTASRFYALYRIARHYRRFHVSMVDQVIARGKKPLAMRLARTLHRANRPGIAAAIEHAFPDDDPSV